MRRPEIPNNTADMATRLSRIPIQINRTHIPLLPSDATILDIGSGTTESALLGYLRQENTHTRLRTVQLDYFRSNLEHRSGNRVVANAIALPFVDEAFPVVTHSEITKDNPYLSDNALHLFKMAHEIKRVLSPGGLYIVYNEVPWLTIPKGLETVYKLEGRQENIQGTYKGLLYGVYKKV